MALGVLELGDDRGAVDDQSGVGGIDHVRQARDRRDAVDGVAEPNVGVAQVFFPLGQRQPRVHGCAGVHPGGLIAYSTVKYVGGGVMA